MNIMGDVDYRERHPSPSAMDREDILGGMDRDYRGTRGDVDLGLSESRAPWQKKGERGETVLVSTFILVTHVDNSILYCNIWTS